MEAFRDYQMQINAIEESVKEMFDRKETEDRKQGRVPKVTYPDYLKYQMLARHYFSIVRKYQEPKLSAKLGERYDFIEKQRLDPEAAEAVKQLVIEAYRQMNE